MGITLECKDDGPIFEIGSDTDATDGGTSEWVDVNTEKFDAVLDSIADFLNDIFGGGEGEEDPPPGGGEGDPPLGKEIRRPMATAMPVGATPPASRASSSSTQPARALCGSRSIDRSPCGTTRR